jgi:prepilin-type N-terminal cleavage/methylation domain-containing protein
MHRTRYRQTRIGGQQDRSRRGWTLIEMLVTIAVMGVLTGVAVKTLAAMLKAERAGVEHVARLATISRMARQFRADIHAATAVEIPTDRPAKPLLVVTIGEDHQVHYEPQPQGLLRTELHKSQPGKRELWRLKHTEFQCAASNAAPEVITLIIRTDSSLAASSTFKPAPKEIQIDAIRGRDRQ